MAIWVDADACPRPVRDILLRAAERRQLMTTFVANQALNLAPGRYIRQLQVPRGFDVADDEIVRRAQPGDLVITADIPLAAEVIEKGAEALSPRGEPFSPDTIRERLAMRDLMDSLRSSGMASGGPPPLAAKDHQQFANALDRYLARTRTKPQQND